MGNTHPSSAKCPCSQDLLSPGSVPARRGFRGNVLTESRAYTSRQTECAEEDSTAASPLFYFLWPKKQTVIKYLLVSIRETLRPVILMRQANKPREVARHRVPGFKSTGVRPRANSAGAPSGPRQRQDAVPPGQFAPSGASTLPAVREAT